ncbi:hypothetical protein [Pacificibacter sp. AS14]|uniref:hypothetical protein n=1 Tax=Pacificibacter sp. AS14 TaxID=3135785 RepID=UPI00317B5455
MKRNCIAVLAACIISTPSIASAGYVAAIASDDCIITAGRSTDNTSIMDEGFAHLETVRPDKFGTKSLVASALAAEFAQTVVKFGVSAAGSYVKSRAADATLEYDQVLATNLLSIESGELVGKTDAGTKWSFPVKINPSVRCVTVVTNVGPVVAAAPFYKTDPSLLWDETWDETGPDFNGRVVKRLHDAGFEFTNPNPSTVFEARWEFSPDGKGIILRPLYFTAKNFESTKQTNAYASNGTRSVGYTITLSIPKDGNTETKLASQNIVYQNVRVKDGVATLGIQSVSSGFGPKWAGPNSSSQGWEAISIGDIAPADGILSKLNDPKFDSYPLAIEPLNIRVKVSVTEEASELYTFLAKFIEDNKVESRISEALISEFGLFTDDQKKEDFIDEIEAKITELEAFNTLYKLSDVDTESDEYKEQIKKYETDILELKILKAQITYGCDPTGGVTTAECSVDEE